MQQLGVGSLLYTCWLAGLLWAAALPLRPKHWSYPRVLTLVSLTALPGALYAIPVERWTSVETAAQLNLAALVVVAGWRVGMLVFFLRRAAQLNFWDTLVATLAPIMAVVTVLGAFNAASRTLEVMAGLRETGATDVLGELLGALVAASMVGFWIVAPLYVFRAWIHWLDSPQGRKRMGYRAGTQERDAAPAEATDENHRKEDGTWWGGA